MVFMGCLLFLIPAYAAALTNGFIFVYPEPADSRVEIVDTGKNYYPGIPVKPGVYLLEITKNGYEKYQKQIHIESGEIFDLFVELKKSSKWIDPETGIELIWIPEGCFIMGCGPWADNCEPDETPAHKTCVDGFWMSKNEITQGVWKKIMGENPSRFQKGDNYPVERVSWNKAMEFVSKLTMAGGYNTRLPTEAEWEYAARGGGKNEMYAGGNNVSQLGWYQANSQGTTHPVGKKNANYFGLHDMSGNVWEWCQDNYSKDAYSQNQNTVSATEPNSIFRVRRGGSWGSEKHNLRTLFRSRYPSDLQLESNGLRIVVDPN